MTSRELNPDTQAILLLCGSLGGSRSTEAPLNAFEYHKLAQWLHANHMRPGDLLQPDTVSLLSETWNVPIDVERIARLINRGAALALIVESWSNKGLWVISRSDPEYPQRVKSRLSRAAPPILYGVGDCTLLAGGGLAIVGSRDGDEPALAFARRIATVCGEQGMQVVSGAARGIDSEAMLTALAAGGTVVGVLADSLLKAAVAGKYREALRAGKLALVTAYEPEVSFTVRNAMGRNKYIYTLSDYAIVVSTSLGEGGTWNGATENIAAQWVPLFVRSDMTAPAGNQRLIEMSAIPMEEAALTENVLLSDLLAQSIPVDEDRREPAPRAESTGQNHSLLEVPHVETDEGSVDGSFPLSNIADLALDVVPEPTEVRLDTPILTDRQEMNDLFNVIWPYFERELQTSKTEHELANSLHLEVIQVRTWLQRAMNDGKVTKLKRPVRYIAASQQAYALL